jgi:lipopolysaccharide transport system ATP-binding protein
MKHLALQAEGLGKQYALSGRGGRHDTLRDLLSGALPARSRSRGARSTASEFWALKNVSFEIACGETVGIIGLNGAGKSTLLKILARIVEPTTGVARVRGRVGALLEVGTGFHWELSGRENVFLYGSILGMSKAEIGRKFDAIVDFAGVADFIDTPVKRYSSGMYVRLAFAVAAHLEPDILFVDEVLSVGDLPFQRKCMEFAKRLHEGNATTLFVSHNMFSIKTMCRRVLYLRHGEVVFDGSTDEGIKLYEEDCRLSPVPWIDDPREAWPVVITECQTLDEASRPKTIFEHGDRMKVRIRYRAGATVHKPNFIVAIIRSDGVACCNFSTELDGVSTESVGTDGVLHLQTPPLRLVAELYTIHVIVRELGFQKILCAQIGSTFHIRHPLLDVNFGVFHERAEWTCDPHDLRHHRKLAACDPLPAPSAADS